MKMGCHEFLLYFFLLFSLCPCFTVRVFTVLLQIAFISKQFSLYFVYFLFLFFSFFFCFFGFIECFSVYISFSLFFVLRLTKMNEINPIYIDYMISLFHLHTYSLSFVLNERIFLAKAEGNSQHLSYNCIYLMQTQTKKKKKTQNNCSTHLANTCCESFLTFSMSRPLFIN